MRKHKLSIPYKNTNICLVLINCLNSLNYLLDASSLTKKNFIQTSSILNSTNFNVQDEDDFKERVLQSKVPVIADFHAE